MSPKEKEGEKMKERVKKNEIRKEIRKERKGLKGREEIKEYKVRRKKNDRM